jgi:hypothetical protein
MLRITCHGGKCCGIKHIFGFPYFPLYGREPKLKKIPFSDPNYFNDEDSRGYPVNTKMMVYNLAAPEEPLWDRMDRYLKYLREIRPGGIVECTLAKQFGEWDQIKLFEPSLFERGFKMVNEERNSNSNNIFRVYHLNMLFDQQQDEEEED